MSLDPTDEGFWHVNHGKASEALPEETESNWRILREVGWGLRMKTAIVTDSATEKTYGRQFWVRSINGLALAALSAVLFILAFPPYDLWLLIWIGLVPMVVAHYCSLRAHHQAGSQAGLRTGNAGG